MTFLQTYQRSSALTAVILGLATACAAAPQTETGPIAAIPAEPAPAAPTPAPSTPAPVTLPAFPASGHPDIDAWRVDFAQRAVSGGRDAAIVYATLRDLSPLAIYLEPTVKAAGIADQAEFAKPIWDYVDSAVSENRKTRGAEKLVEFDAVFDAIETRYGVDREALTAIWAMETNLGSFIGTHDAPNTLANMAVEGRRQGFAENELLALMKMQERGDVARGDLTSGWAGAMGQTQFMPSTFLAYAVDFDGDGRKNLWSSAPDALASAANYLSASGYQSDQPWGVEVVTGRDFDWALADGQDRRLNTWKAAGLKPLHGPFPVDDFTYGQLWLPTGATGPKYLLFKNFHVFKTYNRSDSYAFSVGLLTDGVAGRDGPDAAWPTEIEMLTRTDIETLQASLNALGFDAGPVDGIAGRGTRAALQRFQKARGLLADGYPSKTALNDVLAAVG